MMSRLISRPVCFEISPRVTGGKYAISVSAKGLGPRQFRNDKGEIAPKRERVAHLQAVMGLSERQACSLVDADRR
jgi:hypothetical protein